MQTQLFKQTSGSKSKNFPKEGKKKKQQNNYLSPNVEFGDNY